MSTEAVTILLSRRVFYVSLAAFSWRAIVCGVCFSGRPLFAIINHWEYIALVTPTETQTVKHKPLGRPLLYTLGHYSGRVSLKCSVVLKSW